MICFSKFTKLNYWLIFLPFFFLLSCSDKKNISEDILSIPVDFEIERFDKLFYETTAENLPALKKQYPFLFPQQYDNDFWLKKKNDTLFGELYDEVEKKFNSIDSFKPGLKLLFQHIKYYYPEEDTKRVITLISEVDLSSKVVYSDSLVFISLDTYLGKDHKFYQGFPGYIRAQFEPSQILPDLAKDFISYKISLQKDNSLLNSMILQGKLLYATKRLLPNVSDSDIMLYTPQQFEWCIANEEQIWSYFVNEKLLYSTDSKLQLRFIQPSPFSKFYLDIDSESPGRVGCWLGWQIVDSYMNNNDVTLQSLMQKDYKEIFEQSRYKPRK